MLNNMVEELQAALDGWVSEYNTARPHQSCGGRLPVEGFRLADLRAGAGLDAGTAATALTPFLETVVLPGVRRSLSRHRSTHVAQTPEDAAEAAGERLVT